MDINSLVNVLGIFVVIWIVIELILIFILSLPSIFAGLNAIVDSIFSLSLPVIGLAFAVLGVFLISKFSSDKELLETDAIKIAEFVFKLLPKTGTEIDEIADYATIIRFAYYSGIIAIIIGLACIAASLTKYALA